MIGKRLRSIPMRAAVIGMLPFLIAGCFFNLSEKKDFKSWYYGDPGLAGALGEAQCDRYADHIEGPRHPYFLHFRTPEILLQPQGGAHYPERQTSEHRVDARGAAAIDCEKVAKGWETFRFDAVDAGLLDAVIPYRKASAVNDRERGFGRESLSYAGGVVYNTGLTAAMKAPIYIVHDILKTIYIPVAGTYYLFKPDEPSAVAPEIIQARGESPSEEGPPAAMASAESLTADAREAEAQTDAAPHPAAGEPADDPPGNEAPATQEDPASPSTGLPAPEAGAASVSQHETAGEVPVPVATESTADAGPTPGTAEPPASSGAAAATAPESPAAAEPEAAPAPEMETEIEAADEMTARGASFSAQPAAAGSGAIASDQDQPRTGGQVDSKPRPASEETDAEAPDTPVRDEGTSGGEESAARGSDATLPAGVEADPAPPAVVDPESGPAAADTPVVDVDDRPAAESPDPVPAEDKVAAPQTPLGMPAADVTGEDDTAPQHQKIDAQMETASTPDPPEPEAVAASEESASEEPDGPLSANEEADAEGRPNDVVEDAERSAMPEPDSQAPDLTAPEERSTEAVAETAADTGEAAPPDQGEAERLDTEVGTGAAATPPAAMAEGASGMDEGDPASDGADREIVEEDLLTTEPSGSESPAAAVDDAVDAAAMPDGMPPADTGAADSSMASVSPDQDAAQPEVPAVLEARDKVRIAKNELRKKVAFIGFFSRAVNVDAKTKTALQDLLWPVFEKECRKDLMLMHRGDADYPAALDALMRDQFGHLNSFELTTVARFSGLNAIVAGTIIDIRVSKRLSGILWYKTPEGQLRLTILAEVFDAETGTKLLDHTYIREEEVEELEPGADEKLRKEDLPILEAALQSVAEEMGDHVCDALADQPWRAFVSGINGNRITLSSGQSAGLQPGNILGVYNSQIIDGLNNQQFFLTGEKMGRIQVINVHDDRSEALLIEGQGLRDYSVAIPE